MPCLLCFSPRVLDQSFPRSTTDLHLAADTLGNVQKLVDQNEAHIIFTDFLAQFISDMDWTERSTQYPILNDIHRLLSTWINIPTERVVCIPCCLDSEAQPHPLPEGIVRDANADIWSLEVGSLLRKHDYVSPRTFFLGIVCEYAFCGYPIKSWQRENGTARSFPLVGPTEVRGLDDAYEWDLPIADQDWNVTFESAKRNVILLGATKVEKPHRDSHYKVVFPQARRPWLIDKNVDPVPDRYLDELVSLLGIPLRVVKYTLATGRKPFKNILKLLTQ